MKNTYYHTCPLCGANLDPDERCEDCNPREHIPYPSARDYKAVERLLRKEGTRSESLQANRK